VLLLDGRLDTLRAELRTVRAAQWRRLYEQCDWYRGQTPPAEHPTASITYFGPAAANLALAYRLTGRRGYLEECWRWISACAAYPHWGKAHMPDHDLDAGWLLHGLSLAYSWLGDDLDAERRALLREKLELQGGRLWEYVRENKGTWWTDAYWQNHNWICWTGLAAAGYALGRDDWTAAARANLETVLSALPADGSDSEGVVYWRYGVPWLAVHADLVQHAEGDDLFKGCDFLRNTVFWRLHQSAGGTFEENIDHGDCHDRRSGHSVALYYRLAAAYADPAAQWLGGLVAGTHFWREAYASGVRPGVMPEAYLELLWYDPQIPERAPDAQTPATAYFPDLGQISARTGWDASATVVSFKSAPGGGHRAWEEGERLRRESGWDAASAGHHHPDAGAFVIASRGAFLAVDEGYSNRKRAAHHNLVLVDGQGWADEDRYHVYQGIPYERRPRLRDVLADGGFAHATSETACMFPADLGVTRLDRTLAVTPLGRVVVLDLLAARAPRAWTFVLHADWPAEALGDDSYLLASGPAQARLTRLAPQEVRAAQGPTAVEANPTSSTPSLRIDKTLQTLSVTTDRRPEAAFLHVAECGDAFEPAPAAAERLEAAEGWAVRVGRGADEETVLLAPLTRRIDAAGVRAQAAAVILSGGRTAVVGARAVEVDGRRLLDTADPVTRVMA